MTRAPRRQGFTLLEMLLVLALILLISVAATPSLLSMLSDAKLQAAADHLRARFAEARSRAIQENRAYRFAVMPGQSDYRLAPDSPEYWGEGQPPGEEAVAPLIIEDKLPENIPFQPGEGQGRGGDSGGWVHLLSYQADGSCDNDCSFRLEFEDCRPIEITVRSLTGSVTVRNINPGGN